MPVRGPAQTAECFHLAFLEVLRLRVDSERYVLKGGANLRFFFGSPRYSEDIDLDVSGPVAWTLKENVDRVLSSEPLAFLLRSSGLEISEISEHKQTETTRRWKVGVAGPGGGHPVRTKIEFSNRNGDDRFVFEAVPGRLVASYGVRAPSVQHYTAEAAIDQKVAALAGRSETQARDVFDLELLMRKVSSGASSASSSTRVEAAERGLDLTFGAFRDQVLPFLEAGTAELYDESAWDRMQSFVVSSLTEGL